MNRQFDELYEKKPEENKEVVFDEEERVEDEDGDAGDSLFGEEEEIVGQKKYSITQLSDDEMEIEEVEEKKESEGKIANQPQKSSLLKMNKEGRLVKEKPQVSVMDMFKKAKQRQQEQESSESEIEPEIIEPEEEQLQEQEEDQQVQQQEQEEDQQEPTNTQPTTEEKEMVEDENTYEGDIQPTAEDYERYKQMMSENRILSFN